jgi:slime mold repeat-containing protein
MGEAMREFVKCMCIAGMAILAAALVACGGKSDGGKVKQAVHDIGEFELDRNTPGDPAVAGLDWGDLYPAHAGFTFIADAPGVTPLEIFTGGGSKDDLDVTQWAWAPTENVPDKDQILDAYAYFTTKDIGGVQQKILYFGLDRFDNNGTANVGWWFFQNAVAPAGVGGGAFTGTHTCGDILVQASFTGGGKVDSVTVFQWVGPTPANPAGCAGYPDPDFGTLQKIAPIPGATVDCSAAGFVLDAVCATVNQVPTAAPWPFRAKNSKLANGIMDTGTFIEGGINLTGLNVDAQCFSSFLAETRSSEPFNSVLKDFAMGPFVTCDDSDVCTADACDPVTGCTFTPVSCDDGDACTTDACDPITGCSHTAISCDDNDACTADACDPATGCSHTPITCNDNTACTTDTCNPATGCVFTGISCDDGNACTADACDPITGCSHSAVSCDDSNACTADACDPVTGCSHSAISCDDSNACTNDSCDPVTGCGHSDLSCDDSNACTTDACDPATGCTHGSISCDDGDACTADACDPVSGCTHTALPCGEWCSPGYWANNLACWPDVSPTACFGEAFGGYCNGTPLKTGTATGGGCVTLAQVLANPNTYGGEAFNCVGDLLSTADGLVFTSRVDNCPFSAASANPPCARK